MKNIFKVSALTVSLSILAGCSLGRAPDESVTSPITVFVSNDIITLSEAIKDKPTAIAVQDGKIINIGHQEALIEAYKDESNLVVDTQYIDKTILPGFVEPHMHIWMSSLLLSMDFITPADWAFPWGYVNGVQNEKAYFDQLTRLEQSLPEDEPLITWGYHNYFHGQNMSKKALNKLSETRPIIVWHRSFHEVYFNDAALKMLGWKETDWKKKQISQLNWDKGHAYETGLKAIMNELFMYFFDSGRFAKGVKRTKDYVHSGGITTVIDPGVLLSAQMYNEMVDVLTNDTFPMDYWLIPAGNFTYMLSQNDAEKGKAMAEQQTRTYKESDQINWLPKYVKLFSDGAMYSQLMHMKDGYTDGHKGEWIQKPEELEDSMRPYWNDDYTVIVHANGDLGFETAIDIVETLNNETPREDHRTGYHHLGFTGKDDITRAVDQGANFSVNPYYTHILGELYSVYGIGKERAETMSRGQSFIDAGGVLSLHSDAPMAPAQPLSLAWAAVNRLGLSGSRTLGPLERISVEEALKAITINAAYTARLENQIGTIDVGKYANFTVLDESPFEVDPKDLNKITVSATVYRGEPAPVKHSNAGLDMTLRSHKAVQLINRLSARDGSGDFCTTSIEMQRSALGVAEH
ncbi:amidohydrolase [Endozoicomonas sp. 8E]|uniref:amidohydrolase n=1 Tax=Endozoicomonas sp. 8E TaxID=3035692 RepID=UPI002938E7ED|nr:amidohydrolase [Endozoicomonas sp. 8E]WOG26220.1 amidohydrolase [Endozoicomonas sp. 8E]